MTDADLTDLVKNIDFDTEPGAWDQDTNKDFVDETDNLGPRRNAPRNVKISGDDLSEVRSTNQEESLEDSMDAMDFHGYPLIFMWGCVDIHRYPLRSVDVRRISMDIHGYHIFPWG